MGNTQTVALGQEITGYKKSDTTKKIRFTICMIAMTASLFATTAWAII